MFVRATMRSKYKKGTLRGGGYVNATSAYPTYRGAVILAMSQ